MPAYFDHTTSGQDDDPVGSLDRGEPMGDHKRGPVFHEIGQGHLDHALRFRIQRRGGLVEDEDGGITQQRPRDGQSLAFPA